MLVTITGPTCSGKSTLETALVEIFDCSKIVSFTTREIRAGEIHGVDYYYMKECPPDEDLVEKIHFNGNFYGILKSEVNKASEGLTIVVVEPNGVEQLDAYCRRNGIPIYKIFISQPNEVLVSRFLNRFRNDPKADATYYAHRLLSLVDEAKLWYNDPTLYDAYFTGDDLVKSVSACLESIFENGLPTKREAV